MLFTYQTDNETSLQTGFWPQRQQSIEEKNAWLVTGLVPPKTDSWFCKLEKINVIMKLDLQDGVFFQLFIMPAE